MRKYSYVNISFAATVFNDRDDSVYYQHIPRSFEWKVMQKRNVNMILSEIIYGHIYLFHLDCNLYRYWEMNS